MSAELRDRIVDITLSLSPSYQKLVREREWYAMQVKHHDTEAGLARKRLEAVDAQLKEIGNVF